MNSYVTGGTIRELREKLGYTQKQLAEQLAVSDKTVSKWETGKGLPDISLVEPLAQALRVSVAELLSGECVANRNRSGNPARGRFYICPVCGNVIWSMGEGAFSCCGIVLPPLVPEEPDGAHEIKMERLEDDWYVTLGHPMEKKHFLTFAAIVTHDRVEIHKLYPEQEAAARLRFVRSGYLYVCCNRHGLYRIKL